MIKWGCIQPLTGGMYIGARNAIGRDAQWIISYKGQLDVKTDKEGNITTTGNEYNLIKWLEKQGAHVPYYTFKHKMFEYYPLDKVDINTDTDPAWVGMLKDIDLVVAVPVCSGLSAATIASDDTKNARNCNMQFITDYTLSVIKPKVYIFENAPALYSSKSGEAVRNNLNNIAKQNGYSIAYYKTDTQYHDNCQHRQRTFVIFIKYRGEDTGCPDLHYEKIKCSVEDYLNRIPKDATQKECIELNEDNKIMWDFIKYHYGENYRDIIKPLFIDNFIKDNLWDEFSKWIETYDTTQEEKDKILKLFEHIQYKISLGKNFYCINPKLTYKDSIIPACMFQTIPTLIHYKEDRLYNIREYLHMMGMPMDFELCGKIDNDYAKIGQNVPGRTAQWIVSEAVRIINNWDSIERNNESISFFDNTK